MTTDPLRDGRTPIMTELGPVFRSAAVKIKTFIQVFVQFKEHQAKKQRSSSERYAQKLKRPLWASIFFSWASTHWAN